MKNHHVTVVFLLLLSPTFVIAKEKDDTRISLANGNVTLNVAKSWTRKKPRSSILAFEFSAPSGTKELTDGRLTIMSAGGSIKANLDRWIGQFSQPDGKASKETAKISEKSFNKNKVHLIDVSGTFNDRRGPFAPGVKRENYRMLGAIIPTEKHGQFFLKFYGPKETIKKHEKDFTKMLESLQVSK